MYKGFKVFIPLTQGQVTVIDYEDYDKIKDKKWHTHKRGGKYYASTNYRRKDNTRRALHIHRVIINCPNDKEVDHIDGETLNNCKNNLRICTHQENMINQKKKINNTSGYKGVSFYKRTKKWIAYITIYGKVKHLGYFKSLETAATAFKNASKEFHKEFGNLG